VEVGYTAGRLPRASHIRFPVALRPSERRNPPPRGPCADDDSGGCAIPAKGFPRKGWRVIADLSFIPIDRHGEPRPIDRSVNRRCSRGRGDFAVAVSTPRPLDFRPHNRTATARHRPVYILRLTRGPPSPVTHGCALHSCAPRRHCVCAVAGVIYSRRAIRAMPREGARASPPGAACRMRRMETPSGLSANPPYIYFVERDNGICYARNRAARSFASVYLEKDRAAICLHSKRERISRRSRCVYSIPISRYLDISIMCLEWIFNILLLRAETRWNIKDVCNRTMQLSACQLVRRAMTLSSSISVRRHRHHDVPPWRRRVSMRQDLPRGESGVRDIREAREK